MRTGEEEQRPSAAGAAGAARGDWGRTKLLGVRLKPGLDLLFPGERFLTGFLLCSVAALAKIPAIILAGLYSLAVHFGFTSL